MLIEILSSNSYNITPGTKSIFHGSGLTRDQGIMAVIFNTMSTRNAGFNTVDLSLFNNGSQVIQSLMMWVGSSPASTAGGIRTTTLAIVILAIISAARGKNEVHAFRRKIPAKIVQMALCVAFVGASLVLFTTMAIMIESLFLTNVSPIAFIPALYDASSAFGTTGLSIFNNNELGPVSQLLLICLMFIGQLGVSTTILAWSDRRRKSRVEHVEEEIVIG